MEMEYDMQREIFTKDFNIWILPECNSVFSEYRSKHRRRPLQPGKLKKKNYVIQVYMSNK